MPVLIAILAALGVVIYWIYRVRAAADAANEISDVADDVRAAVRRYGYRRQAGKHPCDMVEDPRLAAAGMMAAIAKMDGDPTQEHINALRIECRASFRVSQKDADDIAAYGRWLAAQSQDPDDVLRRLGRVIASKANEDAQKDLISMLTRVASAGGGAPSSAQEASIQRVARGVGVT